MLRRPGAKRWRARDFAIFSVPLLVMGTVCFVFSLQDYSDYTGRAEAEVTSVRRAGSTDSNVIYVDYRAEGRQFTGIPVDGIVETGAGGADDDIGTTLTVAYDPAAPGDPVTAVTAEEGTSWAFLAGAVGLWAGAAALLTAFVARLVRGRAEREAR